MVIAQHIVSCFSNAYSPYLYMVGSFVTAFLFTLCTGPYVIRRLIALKMGQPIREGKGFLLGELHKQKKNTPTMGGIFYIGGILFAGFIWLDLTNLYSWIMIFVTVGLAILGGIDDYLKLRYKNSKGLSPRKKMIGQLFVVATVIAAIELPEVQEFFTPATVIEKGNILALNEYLHRFYIPYTRELLFLVSGVGIVLCWLLWWFMIVGTSNAVNLTDGLDGLAAGCVSIASFAIGIVSYTFAESTSLVVTIPDALQISIYLMAVCGASSGFMWYNAAPAQVFMGDMASLSLGGILGTAAVLLNAPILLALVGIVFVAEALSVIIQVAVFKRTKGTRVFLCAPLHHHFEYKGIPETKVVMRFWIVSTFAAVFSVLLALGGF